jgi:hypothetical protein
MKHQEEQEEKERKIFKAVYFKTEMKNYYAVQLSLKNAKNN